MCINGSMPVDLVRAGVMRRVKNILPLETKGLMDGIKRSRLQQYPATEGGVPIRPMLTDQWYVRARCAGKTSH